MALSEKDVALVQATIEQWERVGAAYAQSLEEGTRTYKAETNACKQQERMCRLREEHDLESGPTVADMAICRQCPIVLATRKTCHGNISKYWDHDLDTTFNDPALAQEFSETLIQFLKSEVLKNG